MQLLTVTLVYLVLSGGNWATRTPQAVVLSPPHPATAILSRHHHDAGATSEGSGSSAQHRNPADHEQAEDTGPVLQEPSANDPSLL